MPASSRKRMQDYRARMRAKGLRPKQFWLPDTKDPAFIEEFRRQLRALRDDPQEKQLMDEIEAAAAEVWPQE